MSSYSSKSKQCVTFLIMGHEHFFNKTVWKSLLLSIENLSWLWSSSFNLIVSSVDWLQNVLCVIKWKISSSIQLTYVILIAHAEMQLGHKSGYTMSCFSLETWSSLTMKQLTAKPGRTQNTAKPYMTKKSRIWSTTHFGFSLSNTLTVWVRAWCISGLQQEHDQHFLTYSSKQTTECYLLLLYSTSIHSCQEWVLWW